MAKYLKICEKCKMNCDGARDLHNTPHKGFLTDYLVKDYFCDEFQYPLHERVDDL